MSYTTEIMVFCLVLGDDLSCGFEVGIKKEKTISYLQKKIKKANEKAFTTIDACNLKLWKVEIPTRTKNNKWEILETWNHDQIDIEKDLEGVHLQPYDTVEELFKQQPIAKHIHIIVQPLFEKRKLNISDEDQERKKAKTLDSILLLATLQFPDIKKSSMTAQDSDAPDFVAALKDPFYIFIDLNNASKYIKEFDEAVNPSIRIGARVAIASGLVSENLSVLSKMNNVNLFRLPNVIYEILKRRFKTKQHSVEAIIIHIDEYQLYINDVQNYQQISWANACDYFESLLGEIRRFMRNSQHEFNGKYFIIPICTGSSAIDIDFSSRKYINNIVELKPLNYNSAKLMFLDKYEYVRQTTEAERNQVVQGLRSYYSSNFNNENVENLSTKFCNFVLNQQHFRISIFDTGFIPKFIDDLLGPSILTSKFDWGNQLFNKISNLNIATVGNNPGNWKSLNDIRTIISFGLTRQLVKRDFLLPSCISIGELERAGLVYLSNTIGEWYTIIMPFIMLKILNNKLLVSHVETVFPDHLLLIPTHDSPWKWQDFELLYNKIKLLQLYLQQETEIIKRLQIDDEIKIKEEKLTVQMNMNWKLSDIFHGAKGAEMLLQRSVRLRKLEIFIEKENFFKRTDSIANLDKLILCDDNVTRLFDEGIFRCHRGCANINHRWVLDSSDNEKKLAIFLQIKYSECDASTTISASFIKTWYETTMESVKNYETEYDIVLVLFTTQYCTGHLDVGQMPHLLLISLENIESYLSPTFAHRALVNKPDE
ncbi:45284_t:CDS:2 [Gigaspora margarita]|uniref:45284_t:CDS:1 n=1 Tax=Gigaspora margarita TaxID=4874 RepID=A0ABN7VQW2_GIGMA|nr:45284_t:CDS:2 [Gigaspora margarita]